MTDYDEFMRHVEADLKWKLGMDSGRLLKDINFSFYRAWAAGKTPNDTVEKVIGLWASKVKNDKS